MLSVILAEFNGKDYEDFQKQDCCDLHQWVKWWHQCMLSVIFWLASDFCFILWWLMDFSVAFS